MSFCVSVYRLTPPPPFATPNLQVGVVGLGGLGHLAIHFLAKAVGAEVYAISHSPSKEEEAKNLGAAHFVGVEDIEDNSLDVVMNTTTG